MKRLRRKGLTGTLRQRAAGPGLVFVIIATSSESSPHVLDNHETVALSFLQSVAVIESVIR